MDGFVAGVVGFVPGSAGLAAAGFGGAGTPDWMLYASTMGFVISTEGPAQSTGPFGQGFDVSMITPNPLSFAYFTTIGAIFCRIFWAISFC